MTNNYPIQLLDCTLRDGGYYNNWDFETSLVEAYLQASSEAKIDRIEIGFRMFPQDQFHGAYAYSTDSFISRLSLPRGISLGVMINAKDFLNFKDGIKAAVNTLFDDSPNSPIQFVRLATHFSDLKRCEPLAAELNRLGYKVCVNLMQIVPDSHNALQEYAKEMGRWETVDVIYLADSLGCMEPAILESLLQTLKENWKGEIGIHAHDNCGKALPNTLRALKAGATWLDSTVLGMGRGAGNTPTEHLLMELNQLGYTQYQPDFVLPIVLDEFSKLKEQYKWGQNVLYYIAGIKKIHPTYIQELLFSKQYDVSQILSALKVLSGNNSKSYSETGIQNAMKKYTGESTGSWSPRGFAENEDILILGTGSSIEKYSEELIFHIKKYPKKVFALNLNKHIPSDLIDAYIASHKLRFISDLNEHKKSSNPLICPLGDLSLKVREDLKSNHIWDYGMSISNSFEVKEHACSVPSPLAIAYALAIAAAAGSKRIFLAGFDGYLPLDPRQVEMERIIFLFKQFAPSLPIISLTPTQYSVQKSSLYAPL